MMRSYIKGGLAVMLAFSATACLDLNVVNENNPDIERALGDPADVEQVIASSFPIFMATFNSTDMGRVYTQLSDEMTTTILTRSTMWSDEPKFPLDNDPQASSVWIPRRPWDNFSECVANTNDGLRQIDEGMRIRTLDPGADSVVDNTDRAYIFAKLMQGMCIGYLSLTLDQVAIATEDWVVPAGYDDQREWERNNLQPHGSMLDVAINSLEEVITRAEAAEPFNLPTSWVNQKSYNNQELIELAHTLIARFMVYNPRTEAERAAVDWQQVMYHTERGLTYDFGPTLESGILTQGNWLGLVTTTSSSEYRMDNLFLGQADQGGGFQRWLETPFEERVPFYIVTDDRRVTGPPSTQCTAEAVPHHPSEWLVGDRLATGILTNTVGAQCSPNGSYFRNRNSVASFSAARGSQYHALYQWYRRANTAHGGYISSTGHYTIASEDENRLFRAEALLRIGGAANVNEAIRLINVSRTRGVRIGTAASGNFASNLPPIPETGSIDTKVPSRPLTIAGRTFQSCVPRDHANPDECGDVWDALIWERKMELTGQDAVRYWADARGLGMLQEGTLVHMPVPGRYLVSLDMPIYTHGGIGGTGAAPAPTNLYVGRW